MAMTAGNEPQRSRILHVDEDSLKRERLGPRHGEAGSDKAMASASSPMAMDYFGARRASRVSRRGSRARWFASVGVVLLGLGLRYMDVVTWSWWIVLPAAVASAAAVASIISTIRRN